jgi:transcriptional regulator with XRE-family HTH domain
LLEFGSSLRLAREAQGLTLADAEKATRVRARYLRALEEGEIEQLPGGAYPRVFLRDYAAYLGLDPSLLLEGVPEPEPEISPQPVGSPIRPLPWRGAAVTALVLGCVAAASLWGLSSRGHHATPSAQAAAAKPAAPKVVRQAAAPHAAPAVATLRAVRGDCWVRVSRGGRVLWVGTLRQGRTLRLGVSKQLVVRLGAPWNVDAQVAGRRLAPFPHRPLDVALRA